MRSILMKVVKHPAVVDAVLYTGNNKLEVIQELMQVGAEKKVLIEILDNIKVDKENPYYLMYRNGKVDLISKTFFEKHYEAKKERITGIKNNSII